ncbi:hypothetical protein P691DRAFT_810354 [Macrolepiota fuliginosa MF-IS2]|uniref:DUF1746 domain-containing protein n=1 Tax=Macrolepiota fuliginosa MF-IS2 TaxID=1400762 RepID=A0A9P6C3R9_9AGAR|nr:hypothetical protein P691DRAFT_810354 [Macrolepiota fuliginosa MF-IS2]
MHTRYYAQRQHLVRSLDTLVQQLLTVSFLMSPSVFIYLSRMFIQTQCGRPREFDPTYPLRFFFGLILVSNAVILWIHALQGASEGRALVIDFVGMSYVPSRLQILSLDLCILVLQLFTTTISYETQLYYTSTETDTPDVLLPDTSSLPSPSTEYAPLASDPHPLSPPESDTPHTDITKDSRKDPIPCVVDLQFAPIISRLRSPAPSIPAHSDSLLPLPNTTSLPLPAGIRMIMRANARTRRERGTGGNGTTARGGRANGDGGSGSEGGRRIPGGLG